MQLTIKTFPKHRPNITLQDVLKRAYEDTRIDTIPGNKEIRLAIEMVNQKRKYEPFMFDTNFHDEVRSILKCNVSNERINVVRPFDNICFKKIIVFKNGKHRTIKVIRWRNPKNVKKLQQRNNSK